MAKGGGVLVLASAADFVCAVRKLIEMGCLHFLKNFGDASGDCAVFVYVYGSKIINLLL